MEARDLPKQQSSKLQRLFSAAALSIALVVLLLLLAREATSPKAGEQAAVTPKSVRNTMTLTVPELVARLNGFTSPVLGSRYLLSATAQPEVRNQDFHVYNYKNEIGQFSIEADNESGRPFSLALLAAAGNTQESAELVSLFAGMGATVLGRGPQAATLVSACTRAAESEKNSFEISVGDFTATCANVAGAWIAVISVTKDKRIAGGQTAVPMNPDQAL